MLLSILTSCKPLAVIGAIGAIAATAYNLTILNTMSPLMGQQAVSIMQINEILYGLGLFLGLIGIRKAENDTSHQDSPVTPYPGTPGTAG